MSSGALRLRVDPPYPGESMSSFLGRTAQFYAMPVPTLLADLMRGAPWSCHGRRDVDFAPPVVLEERLAESVKDWRSPLMGHVGFRNWTLAPTSRRAYCPLCFEEDLAAGRTPFFRMDWIPALVTSCWIHQTPLCDWADCDSAGRRRLPKEWLYKKGKASQAMPGFMRSDLTSVRRLGDEETDSSEVGEGLKTTLSWLGRTQHLVEKHFDAPMPASGRARTAEDDLRSDLRCIVEFAARHQDRHREPPLADTAWPRQWPEWFGPLPVSARRRQWKFSDSGIRQTGCVRWRRSYLFFAVRTLVGTKNYGPLIAETSSNVLAWTVWWDEIRERLGPQQREALEWHRKVSMKTLV